MTDKTTKKSKTTRNAAIGAAATIGSAAIAAAMLYAGKRLKKNTPTQPPAIPSGEKPETD